MSTLKQVLAKDEVLDNVLHDFCDGQIYQDHPLFSIDPSALQIIAHYDYIEVCNPLGSSSKKHKLGIFLFSLVN